MKVVWRSLKNLLMVSVFWGLVLSPALHSQPTRATAGGRVRSESLRIKILAEYPHDRNSFTQGLLWHDGKLYESVGRYGQSRVRVIELESGRVLREVPLSFRFFGEGLARVGDQLIQLTWREGTAFVYNLEDLSLINQIRYDGEGWGLTYDGSWLILSDGSESLTFRDPKTLQVWRRLPIKVSDRPVQNLNELEFAKGFIYANVWQTSEILKIHGGNGTVAAVIDASSLPYKPLRASDDVLNGIAYIPERDTFLVTGKLWPKIYEVTFE